MRIAVNPCRVTQTYTQTIVFTWLVLWFSIKLEKSYFESFLYTQLLLFWQK